MINYLDSLPPGISGLIGLVTGLVIVGIINYIILRNKYR